MQRKSRFILSAAMSLLLAAILVAPAFPRNKKGKPQAVTGHLIEDTVWSGRIRIIGDVIVPEGVTLTIKPGTRITFAGDSDYDTDLPLGNHVAKDKCNIVVKGTLKALGKKKSKIEFGVSRENVSVSERWGGIVFVTPSDSVMKHCRVENAVFGVSFVNDGNGKIERSIVQNCNIGIYSAGNASGTIESTVISKCNTGIEATDYSFPSIKYNFVTNNEWGVSFSAGATPIISNNVIESNELGISCAGNGDALVKSNEVKKKQDRYKVHIDKSGADREQGDRQRNRARI